MWVGIPFSKIFAKKFEIFKKIHKQFKGMLQNKLKNILKKLEIILKIFKKNLEQLKRITDRKPGERKQFSNCRYSRKFHKCILKIYLKFF